MKSNLISKSETNSILKNMEEQWKIELPKIKNLKFHHINDRGVIITGKGITAIKVDEQIIPFLDEEEILKKFPYVMVDMGAIKFVCKGANIMRPGITKFSEFQKEQIICIIEESQKKFLGVGKAVISSEEMKTIDKGEVVKNLHYISDEFWEAKKEIRV